MLNSDKISPALTLVGQDVELSTILAAHGIAFNAIESAGQAFEAAPAGSAVIVLADDYPTRPRNLAPALYQLAAAKGLRLYLEFAAPIPGVAIEPEPRFLRTGPYGSILERIAVAADFFEPGLARAQLLSFNACSLLPAKCTQAHLVLGRMAGFDHAALGIPEDCLPVLFTHPDHAWLIATTCLSRCREARCGPTASWQLVWENILRWLNIPVGQLEWTATVRPAMPRGQALLETAAREAIARACGWVEKSKLLLDAANAGHVRGLESGLLPLPEDWRPGDGSKGIMESYTSKRLYMDGRQSVSIANRPDCCAQMAAVAALGARLFDDDRQRAIATNLLNFTFHDPDLRPGAWSDAASPLYGLFPFDATSTLCFSDDNARTILGGMLAGALMNDPTWDEAVLVCILANLRTTGQRGFRPNKCLVQAEALADGWLRYWEYQGDEPSPHFHAWIWACFLWLYDKTGFQPLLERARNGLETMMNAGIEAWSAEGGRLDEELAHMLLPLAWLLRVEDTPRHRGWADVVTEKLLALQDACGAIAQHPVWQWSTEIDPKERRRISHPLSSNEEYGIEEGPVVYQAGDTGTDLLYTLNFALFGLLELAGVSNKAEQHEALQRMIDFCIRVQTRSEQHPELDGTWFRGFDYGRWDYWGSDSDWGYGVLTTETGWTHSLITLALGLHELGTTAWEATRNRNMARHFERVQAQLFASELNRSAAVAEQRAEPTDSTI